MAELKTTPMIKTRFGIPTKSKSINFFFTQDTANLQRKWAGRRDFWQTTRPQVSNEAPRWEEFESWRDSDKNGS